MILRGHLSRQLLGRALAVLLLDALIFLPFGVVLRYSAAFALSALLPGLLLSEQLGAQLGERGLIERAVMGVGLGYALLIISGLLLHNVPGPLRRWMVLLSYSALCLLLAALGARPRIPSAQTTRSGAPWTLPAILLLAALLRLVHLGYSEFQGDEVAVLHKAAAAIQGRDDALFLHKKGPAEILVLMVNYAATQRVNEFTARLPFALAGLAAVGATYCLGRRAFGERAALWAALLIAINGYFVAFGRIVQYQSLVLLFSALAILSALRYAQQRRESDLWLCALFLGLGLLAHYDALYAFVPCALLIGRALWQQRPPLRSALRRLLGPLALGVALVLLFYLPFVLHPHFEVTKDYLRIRGGDRPPYNNLRPLLDLAAVYNAIYYLAPLALGMIAVSMVTLTRLGRRRWLAPAIWGAFLLSAALRPELWHVGGRDYVGMGFTLALLLIAWAGRDIPHWRWCLCWFGIPFVALAFWFREPRTHIYAAFPAASLLLGVELDRIAARLPRRAWQVGRAVVAALLALSVAYLYVILIDHTPEYKRTYPAHKLALFWTPYGDTMPQHGLFGFPYRAGWKVVGQLYASGELQGDYGTNEEMHITGWYVRGDWACSSWPRYLFVAENVQDVQPIPQGALGDIYQLFGKVWVGDQVKMHLYERRPSRLPYREYHIEEAADAFDCRLTSPYYPTGLAPRDPLAAMRTSVGGRIAGSIELLGYTLPTRQYRPGQAIPLMLYWRALQEVEKSYTVFTHVEDPGVLYAQKDAVPGCNAHPTNTWRRGEVLADRYILVLDPATPPGPHALIVGLYRPDTGERLPITDASGAPLGDSLHLETIEVLAP